MITVTAEQRVRPGKEATLERWHNDGCRAHEEFEAVVMNYGDPRWDFRRLPAQLKLASSPRPVKPSTRSGS